MDYNAFQISRTGHQQMVGSAPSVSEFGEHTVPAQPGWLSWQAGRLLTALKHESAALKNPAKTAQIQQQALTAEPDRALGQ